LPEYLSLLFEKYPSRRLYYSYKNFITERFISIDLFIKSASERNTLNCLRFLLKKRESMGFQYGILAAAVESGDLSVVEVFLDENFDVNYPCFLEDSFLSMARYKKQSAMVELLVQRDAIENKCASDKKS
jgi:hypothetical protein